MFPQTQCSKNFAGNAPKGRHLMSFTPMKGVSMDFMVSANSAKANKVSVPIMKITKKPWLIKGKLGEVLRKSHTENDATKIDVSEIQRLLQKTGNNSENGKLPIR
jgi:hypothetical protein